MFELMLRNIARDDLVFENPLAPGRFSKPGNREPGQHLQLGGDAAITAFEVVAANPPTPSR